MVGASVGVHDEFAHGAVDRYRIGAFLGLVARAVGAHEDDADGCVAVEQLGGLLEPLPQPVAVGGVERAWDPAFTGAANVFEVHEVFEEVRSRVDPFEVERRELCGPLRELLDKPGVTAGVFCLSREDVEFPFHAVT